MFHYFYAFFKSFPFGRHQYFVCFHIPVGFLLKTFNLFDSMNTLKRYWVLLLLILFPLGSKAQNAINDLGFSGQFFFSYERFFEDQEINNEFAIKRGYITFRRDLTKNIYIRFTQDVSIDKEGDGRGNIELRLKYALVNVTMKDWGFFTRPNVEIGVVRRPWIDFEQKINDYRSQESMLLDQNGIYSSADYGITFATLLGGEIDSEYQERVQSSFPGKYGSLSFGIYNGGGYNALEENNNKLVEGRLSIRPMPEVIPGFQTSFTGALGKGNIPESPDFRLASMVFSFESQKIITLLQGFTGTGDGSGVYVDPFFEPIDLKGWSLFTELKPLEFPVSLTLRADEIVNRDQNRWWHRQSMAGIAYRFRNKSKIILGINRSRWNDTDEKDVSTRFEIVTEVRF